MILDFKKHPTTRDITGFALLLVLFFGGLATVAFWRPDALIGAAVTMIAAWLVSLVVNREAWHLQVLGVFLPMLFLVVGASAQSGADRLGVAVATSAVGVLVGAASIYRPRLGRLAYAGWMLAAFPIGWTVSHLVLGLTYYLVFTPIGVTMRLLGWDPLQRTFGPGASTYWVEHKPPSSPSRYCQQF